MLVTRSITSSENPQWIHLISRQQLLHQQSKSIDPNMLNPTNLTETQGTTRNGEKTVCSICSPTTTISQMNTLQSCSCSTIWTRKPWFGERNSWQPIQSQDKVSISEPWTTSLQPSTQLFNHSIWKEIPCGSCMLSSNYQDQWMNTSLNSEYSLPEQDLLIFCNSSTYSDKVWILISPYKLFNKDPITISKHRLKQQNKEKRSSTWKESIWVENKQNAPIEFWPKKNTTRIWTGFDPTTTIKIQILWTSITYKPY